MAEPARKPLASMPTPPSRQLPAPTMESREPKSIRFTGAEWAAVCEAARSRALEPAVFARLLVMYALSIVQAPVLAEASLGMPAQMLAGSPRTRRF